VYPVNAYHSIALAGWQLAAAESAKGEGSKAGKKAPAKKRGKKDDATPQLSMLAPPASPEGGDGVS